MKNKIEERLKKEMEGKAKSRTKEDKWEMKEYILNCNGEDAKDIMLIQDYICGKYKWIIKRKQKMCSALYVKKKKTRQGM